MVAWYAVLGPLWQVVMYNPTAGDVYTVTVTGTTVTTTATQNYSIVASGLFNSGRHGTITQQRADHLAHGRLTS